MTLSCSSTDFENDSDFRPSRARCCLRFRLCRSIRCVYRLLITCSFPFRRDSYSGQPSVIHITTSKGDSNRIAEDAHYVYHYDEYGRLTEKTDRIPTGVIRTDDERTHHYHYDSQHRLVFHTRIQHGEPLVESRYLYDPLGRRMAKRVWRRERDLTGWMSLSRKPEETWYGWDGDRLTTVQTDTTRI